MFGQKIGDGQVPASEAHPPPSSHQLTQSARQGNRIHQAKDAHAGTYKRLPPNHLSHHDSPGRQEGDAPPRENLQMVIKNPKIWKPNPLIVMSQLQIRLSFR